MSLYLGLDVVSDVGGDLFLPGCGDQDVTGCCQQVILGGRGSREPHNGAVFLGGEREMVTVQQSAGDYSDSPSHLPNSPMAE